MADKKNNFLDRNGVLERKSDIFVNPEGFGVECFEKMKKYKKSVAQIEAETGKSETYGNILQKSIRVALEIESMNFTSDDVLCLCTNTHLEMSLPIWAAIFTGIPMGFLDPSLDINDMIYLVNVLKPKMIFTISESVEILERALKENDLQAKLVVFGETQKHIPFKTFLKDRPEVENYKPKIAKNLFDTVLILFSSGTTGLPKGVCLTHYGLIHQISVFSLYLPIETLLFYSSPYWISYPLFTMTALYLGQKRILCKSLDETKVLKYVQDYQVNFLFLAPAYTYSILSEQNTQNYDLSRLKMLLVGGAMFKEEQLKKINALLPNTIIANGYGCTEIHGCFSIFNSHTEKQLIRTKNGSCGKMLPGFTCKVVDIDTNKICGPHEQGELLVKSKTLMNGYYNRPEDTKNVYDEEGYFHTGDIVYYDKDYCFYIVDRIKELMKYQSWHVVPTELENILMKHPGVKEAIVLGLPHPIDGDHPLAVIVPVNEVKITKEDIFNFFDKQVHDRKKLRGGIIFVKEIPKTITGKFSRRLLRQMILNKELL